MKGLAKKYYNAANPAGFTGDARHLNNKRAQEWLSGQDAYTLHKPVRRRGFSTRSYYASTVDQQWQADLVDMQSLRAHNDGYGHLLTCIDIFSRWAFAIPLKTKFATEVIEAFKRIFKTSGRQPLLLQTDQGKEFENRAFRSYLTSQGIQQFSVKSEYKAALVERFHRTLRARMWRYFTANNTKRWVEVLPKLLASYNNRPHRALNGYTPSGVVNSILLQSHLRRERNRELAEQQLMRLPRYTVGDYVRLSRAKKVFQHGYTANWTREIFVIYDIDSRQPPPMYRVADLDGDVVEGKFYEAELQKVRL